MHRLIMDPPKGMEVDHKDGNTTNCQRSNLRVCTRQENVKNTSKRSHNTSGYKGVSWFKPNKKWGVHIGFDKNKLFLGLFKDKIEAAKAYDEAARKYHGEFAKLNFP